MDLKRNYIYNVLCACLDIRNIFLLTEQVGKIMEFGVGKGQILEAMLKISSTDLQKTIAVIAEGTFNLS